MPRFRLAAEALQKTKLLSAVAKSDPQNTQKQQAASTAATQATQTQQAATAAQTNAKQAVTNPPQSPFANGK